MLGILAQGLNRFRLAIHLEARCVAVLRVGARVDARAGHEPLVRRLTRVSRSGTPLAAMPTQCASRVPACTCCR
jgi:hypothetical protein